MTPSDHAVRDGGFTLIETLIAIVVMATAVITIVSALSGMMASTQSHRGQAVVAAAARSYSEAVEARAAFRTELASDIDDRQTSFNVKDVAGLAANQYVAIDRESMLVIGISGVTLTVTRAVGDPSSAASHTANSAVIGLFRCPSELQLRPNPTTYTVPAGVTVTIDPTSLQYWDKPSGSFVDPSTCTSNYDATCTYDSTSGNHQLPDIRPECGGNLVRLSVVVTTPSDARFRGVDTTTVLLVRRGSP